MQKNSSSKDIETNNLQWKLFIKKKNSHDCNSVGKTIFMQPQRDRMEIKIFEFGEKPGWSVSKAHVDGLALKIFRWNFFSEKRKISFVFRFIIRVYNYFDMYCQRNFMLYVIMSSFYKLKLKPALFFLQSIFYPVQYTYHIMLIGNFASEVYLPHALVSIQIYMCYIN